MPARAWLGRMSLPFPSAGDCCISTPAVVDRAVLPSTGDGVLRGVTFVVQALDEPLSCSGSVHRISLTCFYGDLLLHPF